LGLFSDLVYKSIAQHSFFAPNFSRVLKNALKLLIFSKTGEAYIIMQAPLRLLGSKVDSGALISPA
jgi:hypothetical protein